ncbi:MAG: hypothetical protein J6X66_00995 [Lachnospiraceae bacterium]|nr:hypothetical protein [Lachnospiraceae bacterium]
MKDKLFLPENIRDDFTLCRSDSPAKKLALSLFNALDNGPVCEASKLIMKEWAVLFHLSENNEGLNNDTRKRRNSLEDIFEAPVSDSISEYKALYALHTTYSIIVRIIALKVISNITYKKKPLLFGDLLSFSSDELRNFMYDLEEGYDVSLMGIENITEGDYFSWYAYPGQWNTGIYDSLIEVIRLVDKYTSFKNDTALNAVDIFRELYMEVMPNAVRHSLGEYYTPSWLADHVVNNSLKYLGRKWRALDPCCGSGVFITRLISAICDDTDISGFDIRKKKKMVSRITDSIMGIDINPISVLTARVTYCITLLPLLADTKLNISIPVYLGDSAYPGITENLCGIDCITASVMTHDGGSLDICLPLGFVNRPDFDAVMRKLEMICSSPKKDIIFQSLIQSIGNEFLNDAVRAKIRKLCDKLEEVNDRHYTVNRLRIIKNYMLSARIKNIDLITGNPPWVKWEHLPHHYSDRIKKLCIEKHLFSGHGYMGAIQLNICALIASISASQRLTDSGLLSFLMPRTLLTQDSYAGFRNFYIDPETDKRLYLQKTDDWSRAGSPFIYTTEGFATYYYNRRVTDYKKGIPVVFYKKKRAVPVEEINRYGTFEEVRRFFETSEGKAYQLGGKRTGFSVIKGSGGNSEFSLILGECAYKARTGVELTPGEVYRLSFLERSTHKKTAYFENHELPKALLKAETYGSALKLETGFIYPLVLSPDIKKYSLNYSGA